MATIVNSSVQPWIDFSNKNFGLPALTLTNINVTPCDIPGEPGIARSDSCGVVCTNETLAEYGSVNFNNCGLWMELLTFNRTQNGYRWADPFLSIAPNQSVVTQALTDFAAVGLDPNNASLISDVKDVVSNTLLRYVPDNDFSVSTGFTCTPHILFGGPGGRAFISPSAIQHCVQTICYIRKFHPEIGGIGVFIAMNIQLWIVILSSLFIFIGRETRLERSQRIKIQVDRIITALIEFHQHQCFFFTTLLIAEVLALKQIIEGNVVSRSTQRPEAVPLLASAFLPIVVTHLLIGRYGRMTWYTMLVTTTPIVCSIAVLATSLSIGSLTQNGGGDYGTGSFIDLICGTNTGDHIHLSASSWSAAGIIMTLIMLAISTLTLIFTMVSHIISKKSFHDRFAKRIPRGARKLRLPFQCLGIFVFAFCFIWQVYIYNTISRNNFIATEWTLGQVISSGIWAPAIVEFIYIEIRGITKASEIRYPPGWKVVETLVRRATTGLSGLSDLELKTRESRMQPQQMVHQLGKSDSHEPLAERTAQGPR